MSIPFTEVLEVNGIFYIFVPLKLRNMKHLFLLIGFVLFQNLSAQLLINFGGNQYYQAKIYLENGFEREGYILDFNDEKILSFTIQHDIKKLTTIENQRGLKNEFYYFRESEKGKDEKILLTDIKKIDFTTINSVTKKAKHHTFEKVNLARVNNDLEIQSENEYALLRLFFSNSKIAIYNYISNGCDDLSSLNCRMAITHDFYFRKQGEEYAIKPIDINLFAIGKVEDKFYKSFEYFGKNCPKFLTHLNELKTIAQNQAPKKKYMILSGKETKALFHTKEYDAYEKDIKKMKKKLDKEAFKIYKEERKEQFLNDVANAFYDKVYDELIMNYINSGE